MAGWPLRLGPPTSTGHAPLSPFRRLATLHLFSTAGDAMVTVALAGSVFISVSLTAARGRTALGLLCTFLPFLVVGPFLGPLIDRTPGGRKAMVCVACLGRAGGCALMALWIHGLLFFPAALLTLVCSKAYLVSRAALLPTIVERPEDLVPANAKLAVASAGASSLGGLVAAGVYQVAGSAVVLHLDVVVMLVAAVLATRIRPARQRRDAFIRVRSSGGLSGSGGNYPGGRGGSGPWSGAGQPLPPGGLNLVAISMATMRAVAGLMTALVVFAFRHDGAPLYWYGLVGAASVLGNLGGAALAPVMRARLEGKRIVIGCAVVIGVAGLGVTTMHLLHRWPAALVLAAIVTLLAAVAKLSFDALVQHDGPPARRGRLFARYEALFQGVWVVAALLPVLVVTSLVSGFVFVGLAALVAAGVTVAGLWFANRGRLPRWWPGAAPGALRGRVDLPDVSFGRHGPAEWTTRTEDASDAR